MAACPPDAKSKAAGTARMPAKPVAGIAAGTARMPAKPVGIRSANRKNEGVLMVNKMILIGNVGRVPDIRETSKGGRVASFSLATSEKWTDKQSGDRRERTEWHNVVVFNEHLVEVVERHVTKGAKLYIEGQHRTRDYTDKDGNKRWVSECVLQGYGGTLLVTGRLEGAGTPPPADDFDAYGTGGGGQMSISEEIMAEQGGAA